MTTADTATVTRTELKRYVEGAFRNGPATPEEMIAIAQEADAPMEVLRTLERLNRRSYSELRSLWRELHDLPVRQP